MRSSYKLAIASALGCAALATAIGACSGDTDNNSSNSSATQGAGPGGSGSGGSTSSGNSTLSGGNGGEFNPTGGNDGGLDPDSACASQSAEATLVKKPVDIIFVIDNSGSMGDDIVAVQNNINANFATIIGQSGIDYRVIMVSMHGDPNGPDSICVAEPLSTTNCNPIPAQPAFNPPIFYQYSVEIGSHDPICKLFNSYDGTTQDVFGLAPNGWKDWLRTEAIKVFVGITDDGIACGAYDDNDNLNDGVTSGNNVDAALLALDPVQFGDANKRNYIWHSIIGVKENNVPTDAYLPADPMVATKCVVGNTAAPAPGTGYQQLSILTGGLRFPICQNQSFDVVFQEIAKGVIEGAKVVCEFPVPEAPEGQEIALETVVVQYTPGGMGMPQNFKQVADAAACAPDSFYIENNIIKLCPQSCSVVQADTQAKLIVLFGCDPDVN